MVDTEVRANKKIMQRRYLSGPIDVSDMEVVMTDTIKLDLPPGSTAVIVENLYISMDPYCLDLMARKDTSGSTTTPLSGEVRPNKKVVLRNYVNGFLQESDMVVATDTVRLEVPHGWTALIVKNLYLSCDPYMCLRMASPEESIKFPSFVVG